MRHGYDMASGHLHTMMTNAWRHQTITWSNVDPMLIQATIPYKEFERHMFKLLTYTGY